MPPKLLRVLRVAAFTALTLISAVNSARSAIVDWDVDADQSFVRLNIPDQNVMFDEFGSITLRVRDAGNTATWSDNGGRRAYLGGTITTSYNEGSITFLGGFHNLFALDSGSFRPNPAAFDPNATNGDNPDGQYTDTTAAPAAFAGRLRSSVLGLPDAALFALRDVSFDLSSGALSIAGGTILGGTHTFGIDSAKLDFDGMSNSILGQRFADSLSDPIGLLAGTSNVSGTVTGAGIFKKLTLAVNAPFQFEIGGVLLNASYTGQIVAYLAPEPASVLMAVTGLLGMCCAGRRRFRCA